MAIIENYLQWLITHVSAPVKDSGFIFFIFEIFFLITVGDGNGDDRILKEGAFGFTGIELLVYQSS